MITHEAVLEIYQVHAVTQGTDEQAECRCGLPRAPGPRGDRQGRGSDTLVASAKAYLARNKLMSRASGASRIAVASGACIHDRGRMRNGNEAGAGTNRRAPRSDEFTRAPQHLRVVLAQT